jgi:hypothetical protein
VIVGFLVWLLLVRDDDDSGNNGGQRQVPAFEPFGPEFAGPAGLRDAADEVGHEVYWAGDDEDGEVELTVTADGRVFVRYLTGGVNAGVPEGDYLTVNTLELPDAQAATRDLAEASGAESFDVPGGGLAVVDAANPERVVFTEPGSDLQVQVFDPTAGRARELVESGQIEPIS